MDITLTNTTYQKIMAPQVHPVMTTPKQLDHQAANASKFCN